METKKALSLILAFVFLPILSFAHDFEVDGIYYIIDNDVAYVAPNNNASNSYSGDVVIPSTVTYEGTTYHVTKIAEAAFANCSGLTSVTIPETVTELGYTAFSNCTALTSMTLPQATTDIGQFAFNGCSNLTSITTGKSITSIDANAFQNCKRLSYIALGDSLQYIGKSAFVNCNSIATLYYNAKKCTSLNDAFKNSKNSGFTFNFGISNFKLPR